MDVFKATLELEGKVYTLQHPGNREWVKLQENLINATTGRMKLGDFLDYSFDHVVFPEQGPKLTMDSITLKELEAWQIVLPAFFRGNLEAGYAWKQDKPGDGPSSPEPGEKQSGGKAK